MKWGEHTAAARARNQRARLASRAELLATPRIRPDARVGGASSTARSGVGGWYRIGLITSRNLEPRRRGSRAAQTKAAAAPCTQAQPLRSAAGLLLAAGGADLHAAGASCCLLLFANADELGGHREERLLNVRGRLGARLQERDAQRVGVILRCLARDLRATAA